MAKKFSFQKVATNHLKERKLDLLSGLQFPPDAVRGSCVQQFLKCGKPNCRCRRGRKHGPFHYLVQCLGVGHVNKFLLKNLAQQQQARASIAAYLQFHEQVEQLSQINTELLRRGEIPAA